MAEEIEALAILLCEANEGSWTACSEVSCIGVRDALGTKPFWRRLARAALSRPAPAAEVTGERPMLPCGIELAEFKPCVMENRELGLTTYIHEDVAYVAHPLTAPDGTRAHYVDALLAMDGGRLVGVNFWRALTPSPDAGRVPEGWQLVPERAIAWLLGVGPDFDGHWFDYAHYERRGNFWWRSVFKKMLAASPAHDEVKS